MSKRTCLADVARQAGVSVAAASLALRGAGRLAPATREKIKQAAAALKYHPNPLLASLARRHFNPARATATPLAFLHRQEKTFIYTIPPAEFRALQAHSHKLGFRLNRFNLDEFKDGTHATKVLYARGIQGIVLPPSIQAGTLPGMDWSRFAVVRWGECIPEAPGAPHPDFSRACVDHFGSLLRAWEETRKRGYQRIGIVLFKVRPDSADDPAALGRLPGCPVSDSAAPAHSDLPAGTHFRSGQFSPQARPMVRPNPP